MSKVAVVFWSATGNTETMANCVAEGANGTIVPCSEMNAAKLAEFDAVAFGCPAMGAEQLEAVSYTHLDVYKRQPLCRSRFISSMAA